MPRRCQVESIVPRTFRSGLDVECGGGDIGTHPHAGAETDKERGGRATGSRQIPKEKHNQPPQTLPHHTTLDLSRVTRMNRLSPAVSCALWLEGESEKKQRRHSVFRYGLCPKLRYPSAGCVANAGLAGVAGRAGLSLGHQPILRPFEDALLVMIIMTAGPEVLCQGRQRGSHPPEGISIRDESRPTPTRSHRSFATQLRLASGRDQAGWRQTKPTRVGMMSPSTTHQQQPTFSPPFSLPSGGDAVTQTHVPPVLQAR